MASDQFPFSDGDAPEASEVNRAIGYGGTPYQAKESVTDSVSGITFTNSLKFMIIRNLGPNTLFFEVDGTPTTSSLSLDVNESIVINGGPDGTAVLNHICDTGETADLRILGTY
jgi:hypothetical protein